MKYVNLRVFLRGVRFMAGKKENGGTLEAIAAVVGVVAAIANVAPNVADVVKDVANKKQEIRSAWTYMPDLIGSDLLEAQKTLDKCGLIHSLRPVTVSVKYKDKVANSVIKTSHKAKSKVAPNTPITLDYITQEVVDESKRLAADAEEKRLQKKKDRQEKRAEIPVRAKRILVKEKIKEEE